MLDHTGRAATGVTPLSFFIARKEALEPEKCTASLAIESVLEIF
jgi:hypothetical protein